MAKSTIFCNYVVRLHHDPEELARFKAEPDYRMQLAGLSPAQREALKSKNGAKIREAMCIEMELPLGEEPDHNIVVFEFLAARL